ncbi:MAG TPA: MMPL family transporter [Pseudomonadales bacterium]|nr:MMPL family transporter [Pseudomonadales bacterium]
MYRLYAALVLDRPWLALVGLLALAIVAGVAARDFRLDASSDSLVVETDPDLAYFREINARYGSSDFLIVTYMPEADLLSDESLTAIRALKEDLEAIDGVASVLSVLDVPLLRSPPSPLTELADNIRTVESPDADLELARVELTTSPLYSNLIVSKDGRSTALQVNLPADTRYAELITHRNELLAKREQARLSDAEADELAAVSAEFDAYKQVAADRQRRLVADARAVVDRHRQGAELHLAGVPMIADDMLRFVRNDLETFGVGVLALIIATLAFFFRRIRWVVLPVATSALVTLLMLGLLGAAGWPVTVISSNFVSLLIIISISLNIHLIVRYRELLHENPEIGTRELVEATVRDKFWPCFYTSITTMVAFGSLVTSGIVPVIDFGWMMTIGVAVSQTIAFILFPAVLMLLPPGKASGTLGQSVDATEALGRFTAHGPWRTALIGVVLAGVAAVGISRLTVENSFIDYFDESTEIYQGMSFIDAHLGGTTPLDILIDFPELDTGLGGAPDGEQDDPFADPFADPLAENGGDADDAGEDPFADPFADPLADDGAESSTASIDRYWFTPDKIALIEQVHEYLDAQPETGKVVSLATLHAIAREFNDGEALGGPELVLVIGAVPEQFQESLLRPYASPEDNQARISVRMIESNRDLHRDAFLERIRGHITGDIGLDEDRVHLTSVMVLFNNMLQSLFSSQITTVLWVAGGILFTFVLLFRSLTLGLLALLPNMLAAAMVLGIMGLVGLPLDMMTITIAAIVIGIGVDDTIHYVHRFRQELARSPDYGTALKASHGSIGHAMYYTSLTVIAGFSILGLSNFNPTIYFGSLTALSMAMALLANLTLLPALIVLAKPMGPPGLETREA